MVTKRALGFILSAAVAVTTGQQTTRLTTLPIITTTGFLVASPCPRTALALGAAGDDAVNRA